MSLVLWTPHEDGYLTPLNDAPVAPYRLLNFEVLRRPVEFTQGIIAVPRNGTPLGALFESLVALSVRVFAQPINAGVFHLRTEDDRQEVDLIVESEQGKILSVEVKISADVTDHDVRYLLWLKKQAQERIADLVVVTTEDTVFRRADGIAVVPLALLGPFNGSRRGVLGLTP